MGKEVRVVNEAPWAGGGIRITRQALAALEVDVKARYTTDEEACGYLVGPSSDGLLCDETVPLVNMANKLHALDPETYFRTGREFFAFNEKKFDDAVKRGKESGRPVKVLYHSHLDCGAYFSPTDAAVLSFGEPPTVEGGEAKLGPGPQWPLAFLVSSVRKSDAGPVVDDHKLFVWKDDRFVEAAFEVVDAA
jgi:proteasome lid subunit RPN8/RPN11